MSQLVFQPAFDPLHAAFRFLRLRTISSELGSLSIDQARILDFYLLFPFRIRSMRLAPGHQHFKKLAEKYSHLTPYGEQPDGPLLFNRMRPMHMAALEALQAEDYIDTAAFLNHSFKATEKKIPKELASRISQLNGEQSDLMDFLRVLGEDYEISGPNGLKARSELMDYQYDAI